MSEEDESVLVACPRAAQILGVDLRTIYRMIDRGELTEVKVGRLRKVTKASLNALLQGQDRVIEGEPPAPFEHSLPKTTAGKP